VRVLRNLVGVYGLFDAVPSRWVEAGFVPFHEAMVLARAALAEAVPQASAVAWALRQLPLLAADLVEAPDTSVLAAVLAEANAVLADSDRYQSVNLAALQAAVQAAETVLADPVSQASVDAAASAVLNALAGVHQLGDKSVLAALLQVAGSLVEVQFTPSSWAGLAAAVPVGQAVLADAQASVFMVDDAVAGLQTGLGGLVLRAVKAGLGSAITVAQSITSNSSAYVPSSLIGLAEALTAAQTVYANDDATQAQVTAAQSALVAAIAKAKLRGTGTQPLAAGLAVQAAADPQVVRTVLAQAVKPLAKPVIKGQAKVGAKLRVASATTTKGASYQWYRNGKAIKGATKATYKVKTVDRGKRLSVKTGLHNTSKTSTKTKPVR
jgi:hypothetical protein